MSLPLISWDDMCGGLPELTGGRETALTVGVFDGLHRGHQALIAKITAKTPELLPAVVTFRTNPKGQPFILSFDEKMAILDSLGVRLGLYIDFSPDFSKISGEAFWELLNRHLRPRYVALGTNFHCGYRRGTDAQAFKALVEQTGVTAEIIPPVLEGALPVSSSRIRAALQAGNTAEAELLLGRKIVR
jgi:riboflavin kinase/FMN adenylyltransferase